MKKISSNDYQFTNEEIEEIKKDFYKDVDKLLSQRYEIALPLHAIRILLKTCITDVRIFDTLSSQGNAFSASEGLFIEAKQQIIYIIASELKKHKVNWKSFFTEIIDEVKRKEGM